MITTASSFVSEGLSLITAPLMTFVETHFERELGQDWQKKVRREFKKVRHQSKTGTFIGIIVTFSKP